MSELRAFLKRLRTLIDQELTGQPELPLQAQQQAPPAGVQGQRPPSKRGSKRSSSTQKDRTPWWVPSEGHYINEAGDKPNVWFMLEGKIDYTNVVAWAINPEERDAITEGEQLAGVHVQKWLVEERVAKGEWPAWVLEQRDE